MIDKGLTISGNKARLLSHNNYLKKTSEMNEIKFHKNKWEQIQRVFDLEGKVEVYDTNFDCYRSFIDRYTEKCGKMNSNVIRGLINFYELC